MFLFLLFSIWCYLKILFLHVCSEKDLLHMPKNSGLLPMVQWPLFLLVSKVEQIECFQFSWYMFLIWVKYYEQIVLFLFQLIFLDDVLDLIRYFLPEILQLSARIRRMSSGLEFLGMNTWNMQFRSAITVLRLYWYLYWRRKDACGKCVLFLSSISICSKLLSYSKLAIGWRG